MQKITKAQVKDIRQLHLKKYRQRYAQFLVEGTKSVLEFVHSGYKCGGVFGKEEWFAQYSGEIDDVSIDFFSVNSKELGQISTFRNPQPVVALFEMQGAMSFNQDVPLVLVLDDIRDPGNLGTIIRTADWFGLDQIVCSDSCADCFNSKVIQASMGSMSRMKIIYTDLEIFTKSNNDFKVVLADLNGENLHDFSWDKKSILLIGNEANGVNPSFYDAPHRKITIPKKGKAESLNAAISAAIILANFQ